MLKRSERFLKILSIFQESFNLHIISFTKGCLSYKNQTINLLCKSMDFFVYDKDVRHERVKENI